MLESHSLERANQLEAETSMQRLGSTRVALGDDGDHLFPRALLTSLNEGLQEESPQAAALVFVVQVHGVFEGPTIGGSLVVRTRVGVADDDTVEFGHEMGKTYRFVRDNVQTASYNGSSPLFHLLHRRRDFLEGGDAAENVVSVDLLDPCKVRREGIADEHVAHLLQEETTGRVARSRRTGQGKKMARIFAERRVVIDLGRACGSDSLCLYFVVSCPV